MKVEPSGVQAVLVVGAGGSLVTSSHTGLCGFEISS